MLERPHRSPLSRARSKGRPVNSASRIALEQRPSVVTIGQERLGMAHAHSQPGRGSARRARLQLLHERTSVLVPTPAGDRVRRVG
jgi:hypothetical protein